MSTPLIYKKMSDVMKDIKSVSKDQKNTQQGYAFRGVDDFINALYPALTKHGVFMTPRCTSYTQELKEVVRSSGKAGVDKHVAILMEYDFFAEDGSKVTVGPIPAEGLDSGDKASNKALSAAIKYALIQTFSVPTKDIAEADLDTPEIGLAAKAVLNSVTTTATFPTSSTTINVQGTVTPTVPEVMTTKRVSTFRKAKPTTATVGETAHIPNGNGSTAPSDSEWT